MAKKYNKGRKQKPNYSKRGMQNPRVELGKDLDLEDKLKEQKNVSQCSRSKKDGLC